MDAVGKDCWNLIMSYKYQLDRAEFVAYVDSLFQKSAMQLMGLPEVFPYYTGDAYDVHCVKCFDVWGDIICPGEFKDTVLEIDYELEDERKRQRRKQNRTVHEWSNRKRIKFIG